MVDGYEVADTLGDTPWKRYWNRLDSGQRLAWLVMCGSAAFAVLGVPLLSIILGGKGAPTSKNLVASGWLLGITLPVAAAIALIVYLLVPPPKLTGGPQLLLVAAIAGFAGVWGMDRMIEAAGGGLSDFYCYNDASFGRQPVGLSTKPAWLRLR